MTDPTPTPTPAPLVFIDTETTGLNRRTRRAWDIAAIRREPDGTETTYGAIVVDVDLSDAEPKGLAVGRFYERHWLYGTYDPDRAEPQVPAPYQVREEAQVARDVEEITRGAHLVGIVPSFDEETLAALLRRHKLVPAWHYHLVDAAVLACGRLRIAPPYRSRDISRALGVDPDSYDEHTALGDATWARDLFDAVMTAPAPVTGTGAATSHPLAATH